LTKLINNDIIKYNKYQGGIMKLLKLTKAETTKLQKQYSMGTSFDQMVVAKVFNPYGRHTWYLLNQDPNDPDYLWTVATDPQGLPEMGSCLLSDLMNTRIGAYRLPLERDKYFHPITVKELYEKLNRGEHV